MVGAQCPENRQSLGLSGNTALHAAPFWAAEFQSSVTVPPQVCLSRGGVSPVGGGCACNLLESRHVSQPEPDHLCLSVPAHEK